LYGERIRGRKKKKEKMPGGVWWSRRKYGVWTEGEEGKRKREKVDQDQMIPWWREVGFGT